MRIFRHDCQTLVTKILVSDFPQFYGEASTQVAKAYTRLCMFPSLLGKFFTMSGENRCTFLFAHLWAKNVPETKRRSILRYFSDFSEKLTAHIFDHRPHKWVCLKMGTPVRRVLRHTPASRFTKWGSKLVLVISWHDLSSGEVALIDPIA